MELLFIDNEPVQKRLLRKHLLASVDTLADLRRLPVPSDDNRLVFVKGYWSAGDLGGGYFVWSATSVSVVNLGTVIASDASPSSGRWLRLLPQPGYVTVNEFGAKGDGMTDDSLAFSSAIANGTVISVPPTSSGYKVSQTLVVTSGKSIVGVPHRTKILHFGSQNLFSLQGNDISIEGLHIDSLAATSGWVFYLNTAAGSFERIDLKNIYCWGSKGFFTDANSSTNFYLSLRMENIQCRLQMGPGLAMYNGYAHLFLTRIAIDFVGSSSKNHIGFLFDTTQLSGAVGGLVVEDMDVAMSEATGFKFLNCRAVWLRRVMADHCDGNGFEITNAVYFHFDGVTSVVSGLHGIVCTNCEEFDGSNVIVSGYQGSVGATPNIDGLRLASCQKFVLSNLALRSNTGHGINITTACQYMNFSSINLVNNGLRGIKTTGAGSVLFTGVVMAFNSVGNYDLASANEHLTASQIATGALVTVTGPAVG